MPLPLIPESHPATGADPGRKLRLLEVVRRRARERRYSRRTEEAYVNWIRRFVRFHGRRHPKDMGETEVRDFLSSLVQRNESSVTYSSYAAFCSRAGGEHRFSSFTRSARVNRHSNGRAMR